MRQQAKQIFLLVSIILCKTAFAQHDIKSKITVVGTFHFNQFHDESSTTNNFFSPKKQQEIETVLGRLKAFTPDQIYIEREPRYQAQIDSLFGLYSRDQLKLNALENGAGEVYQLAFRLAKELDLEAPRCVNHYEGTSQSLLRSGRNIEMYQNALKTFQNLGRTVVGEFVQGKATLLETLLKMNLPENIARSHQLLFNIPAYVQDGEFASYDTLDEKTIDKRYIGAEFISLFYERNLKIYSNILNTQLKTNDQRIVFITGQVHVGVLQELLRNNKHFELIEAADLLKMTLNNEKN